ncbi:MAG: ATP-dependent DNA helicase Snf21 [Amphiamblys sp. WSBS2006]|nr:MAG: ATP-dependent DNA helicase Snf21 [Amphiamblys sp. WSBS2006]
MDGSKNTKILEEIKRQIDLFKEMSGSLQQTVSATSAIIDAVSQEREPYKNVKISLPKGIDPLLVKKERAQLLLQLREQKKCELERSLRETPDEDRLLELRKLRAIELQTHFRRTLTEMYRHTLLETRGRTRNTTANFLENLRALKKNEPKPQKKTYEEYINGVMKQAQQRTEQRRAANTALQKTTKHVLQINHTHQKDEQRRQERVAKERMKALKTGNEAEYRKLVSQEKNTRLQYLLQQTDDYLHGLAQKLGGHGAGQEEQAAGKEDGYYRTAHQIAEAVSQPAIHGENRLKEYQLAGLDWLVSLYNNNLNGILADEMGLGKTIQAISLIAYLMERKGQQGPFLVVCPLSTMGNWAAELDKWLPGVKRIEYRSAPDKRKGLKRALHEEQYSIVLTTYEYVLRDHSTLGKMPWLYIILDEGHRLKNKSSKLLAALSRQYRTRFRLVLTGTPLQNNLAELWTLFNFVTGNIFQSSTTFAEWFNAPFANTGEQLELNEEETLLVIKRLHKVLRPFLLRRLKKDVEVNLPGKTEQTIPCSLSALQRHLYEGLLSGTSSEGLLRAKKNVLMQLRKICNHPFLFPEAEERVNPEKKSNTLLYRAAGKLEVLHRAIPKLLRAGHRILFFFQMTKMMTVMEDFLLLEGHNYLRLDGSTKQEHRQELLEKFNSPDNQWPIFLLSTRAGGLGLNLQTADTVFIFDSDWNPHQDLQAQDRAHRIGQQNEVRIYRLVTKNTIEEYILQVANYKLDIDGKVIQAGRFNQTSTSEEREEILRTLLEKDRKDLAKEHPPTTDNEALNKMLARSEEERAMFEKMDREEKTPEPALLTATELGAMLGSSAPLLSPKAAAADDTAEKKTPVSPDELADMEMALAHIEKHKADDGRVCSTLFIGLPSKTKYPDYYETISCPISIGTIRQRLQHGEYASTDEFEKDVFLMFQNAYRYNDEESAVYEDAKEMESAFTVFWENIKDTRGPFM